MISRSHKNLLTTVPSSAAGAKTASRRLQFAILLALGGSQASMAQQGWAPQAFVPDPQTRPLSSAQPSNLQSLPPANRLRGDVGLTDDKPVVLRWRSQTKTQQPSSPSSKSVFEEVSASQPSAQNSVAPAANWTDRTSPQGNRIVRSVVEPEAFPRRAVDQGDDFPVNVVPAQFDVPPSIQSDSAAKKDLFESNLLPPSNDFPQKDSLPSSNGTRSLIEPGLPAPTEQSPNPFPPKSAPAELEPLFPAEPFERDRSRSPSDTDSPPPNLRRSQSGNDTVPRPEATPRFDVKCDDVRDRVLSANIGTIQLDVAPNFGVGATEKQSPEQKREAFSKAAPNRNWFDQSGAQIAQGRLVDLEHDSIVVENQSGSRSLIPLRKLSEPDAAYVFEVWGLPMTCTLGSEVLAARVFEPTTVAWKASGLCHKPLYFEEIQLERSGHEYGPIIQPAISSVHFFTNIALLPYKMGIHPMTECQYALGHYRPGNCAPWSIEPFPLSLRGAAAQAAVVTGGALVLP